MSRYNLLLFSPFFDQVLYVPYIKPAARIFSSYIILLVAVNKMLLESFQSSHNLYAENLRHCAHMVSLFMQANNRKTLWPRGLRRVLTKIP